MKTCNKKKILYFVEPMMGIGPNVDAEFIAERIVSDFSNDIEIYIITDDSYKIRENLKGQGVTWLQLKSFRIDPQNNNLVDLEGNILGNDFVEERLDIIFSFLEKASPDVLLLHNYISGSGWDNVIDFEVLPLINKARQDNNDIKVYSYLIGMIDCFENMSEKDSELFRENVKLNIDKIFLRSDNVDLFLKTCTPAIPLKSMILPVGYSAAKYLPNREMEFGDFKEITVSAGGGDYSLDFFKNVLYTWKYLIENNHHLSSFKWRFFIGPIGKKYISELEGMIENLPSDKKNQVIFETVANSEKILAHLCYNSMLYISRSGQRTFCDLELSGVPSVVIPRESGGKEFEQLYRALFLEDCGRSVVIRESELNTQALLNAISTVSFERQRLGLNMNGPFNLLEFIKENN